MRLQDSPEEAQWRNEVRQFLEKELPDSIRVKSRLGGGEGGYAGASSSQSAPAARERVPAGGEDFDDDIPF